MKAYFIINPSSGKQNFMNTIESLIGKLVMKKLVSSIDVFYTAKKDDARNAAMAVKEGEYDFVVSVGGDGTLNEVIDGMIRGGTKTPVAVISAGTVNDFASILHLPQEPDAFCDMIEHFQTLTVDAGKVGEHYFINVVAAGLLTDIGYKVPKESKAILGKLAYYLEGARDLPMALFQNLKLHLESEEYNRDIEGLLFLITNSKSVGGFKKMAVPASVTDGYLDVVVIRKVELGQVTPLLIKLLNGTHIEHPSVDYFQTKHLKVTSLDDKEVTVDYDGEYYGNLPVEVSVVPGAVNIVVPSAAGMEQV